MYPTTKGRDQTASARTSPAALWPNLRRRDQRPRGPSQPFRNHSTPPIALKVETKEHVSQGALDDNIATVARGGPRSTPSAVNTAPARRSSPAGSRNAPNGPGRRAGREGGRRAAGSPSQTGRGRAGRVDEFEEFDPRTHFSLTVSGDELNDVERNAAPARTPAMQNWTCRERPRFPRSRPHPPHRQLAWLAQPPPTPGRSRRAADGGAGRNPSRSHRGREDRGCRPSALLSRMTTGRWQATSILYVCPLKALLDNLLPRRETYTGWMGRTAALWHGASSRASARRSWRTVPTYCSPPRNRSKRCSSVRRSTTEPSSLACAASWWTRSMPSLVSCCSPGAVGLSPTSTGPANAALWNRPTAAAEQSGAASDSCKRHRSNSLGRHERYTSAPIRLRVLRGALRSVSARQGNTSWTPCTRGNPHHARERWSHTVVDLGWTRGERHARRIAQSGHRARTAHQRLLDPVAGGHRPWPVETGRRGRVSTAETARCRCAGGEGAEIRRGAAARSRRGDAGGPVLRCHRSTGGIGGTDTARDGSRRFLTYSLSLFLSLIGWSRVRVGPSTC
ncbi:hypothetical protein H180DRAFT_01715 [Streptomyces sp. WMMB 322]|nr:hypothetical protein H180DRAFT_01715 [Streptomyces sp. WMMB 322]